jgi:uncharacterized protein YqfA (UPF0365 family)
VRVIERSQHLSLAFEACAAVGIVGEDVGQDFQRDVSPELEVPSAVDLAL